MKRWVKSDRPWAIWGMSEFELKIAKESHLKLPGIIGWLKGGIDVDRMSKLKKEIEERK